MKRTSPVVHQPPKPAKVPHYSNEPTGQNTVSGNIVNERPPHFMPSQFTTQQPQLTPTGIQSFPANSSLEPPLMSPEISSGPASTEQNPKNEEGRF